MIVHDLNSYILQAAVEKLSQDICNAMRVVPVGLHGDADDFQRMREAFEVRFWVQQSPLSQGLP